MAKKDKLSRKRPRPVTSREGSTLRPMEGKSALSESAGQDIMESTVCIEIHVTGVTMRRKIKSQELLENRPGFEKKDVEAAVATPTTEGEMDADLLHAAKEIIDTKEIKAIQKRDAQMRNWVKDRAVPCSILRGGMYLLPLELVEEVEAEVKRYVAEREGMIDGFLVIYPQLKEAARLRLRSRFDPRDYPSEEALRSAFSVHVRYMTFNVPAALKNLNEELHRREQQKAEKEWRKAAEEIRDALRVSFTGLVDHTVDRLGYDNGKARRFNETMVEKMNLFLRTFEARNLTGDGDLAELVNRARDVMRGITTEKLRDMQTFRDSVSKAFEGIKKDIDANIVVTTTRKFKLNPRQRASNTSAQARPAS